MHEAWLSRWLRRRIWRDDPLWVLVDRRQQFVRPPHLRREGISVSLNRVTAARQIGAALMGKVRVHLQQRY